VFLKNYAKNDGSDLFAQYGEQNLTLESVSFQNEDVLNSIYLDQIKFKGRNVNIIKNSNKIINLNHNGGAIDCHNIISFYAENFIIQESKALSGGAISFEETE
jgi:hypothetical protein